MIKMKPIPYTNFFRNKPQIFMKSKILDTFDINLNKYILISDIGVNALNTEYDNNMTMFSYIENTLKTINSTNYYIYNPTDYDTDKYTIYSNKFQAKKLNNLISAKDVCFVSYNELIDNDNVLAISNRCDKLMYIQVSDKLANYINPEFEIRCNDAKFTHIINNIGI